MLFKELLPAEEGLEGDIKGFADLLHGTQPEGVFCQDTEDKEQAVPAVRDNGIREDCVCRWTLALSTGQAAYAETDLHRPAIDEFDQGAVIVGVDPHLAPATAVRTDLGFRPEMIHTTPENRFPGSFFPDKLAIDQVLSYHNSAL